MTVTFRHEASETPTTFNTNTDESVAKSLFQNPRFLGGLIIVLLIIVGYYLIQNSRKGKSQSDTELVQELFDNRAKYVSMVHLAAVLRQCQAGNEIACRLLEEYPAQRNYYIPWISVEKKNETFQNLFEKNLISKILKNFMKEKYKDLDSLYNAGQAEVRKIPDMRDPIIIEIKWLLLEHGYDPEDWLRR